MRKQIDLGEKMNVSQSKEFVIFGEARIGKTPYEINALEKLKNLEEDLEERIFIHKDKTALHIYSYFLSSQDWIVNIHYGRIFGLCRFLGINNLYDIGCGVINHAFLLAWHMDADIKYIGIDTKRANKNNLITKTSDNFLFLNNSYPFQINTSDNNIAISYYCLGTMTRGKTETIKNIAQHLDSDFERILINISECSLETWKDELSSFKLQTLGIEDDLHVVFGTKLDKDIVKLKEENYNFYDDKFFIDYF